MGDLGVDTLTNLIGMSVVHSSRMNRRRVGQQIETEAAGKAKGPGAEVVANRRIEAMLMGGSGRGRHHAIGCRVIPEHAQTQVSNAAFGILQATVEDRRVVQVEAFRSGEVVGRALTDESEHDRLPGDRLNGGRSIPNTLQVRRDARTRRRRGSHLVKWPGACRM